MSGSLYSHLSAVTLEYWGPPTNNTDSTGHCAEPL